LKETQKTYKIDFIHKNYIKVIKFEKMLSYIKLLSGTIYSYDTDTFGKLIELFARDLGVKSSCIKILNIPYMPYIPYDQEDQEDQEDDSIKKDGEIYYAFIEEPKIIDNIYLEVSDKGDVYLSRPFHKLFANSFKVFVKESKFTKDIIDKFRLELWLVGDHDTKDMSLYQLVRVYVENLTNMNIDSISII
jgi:hypothetical protein